MNRAEKKPSTRGFRQDTMGYGKKTALLEEAITQMNAGKYGRSSAVLKELLTLDPHNMEARRLFATLHLRLGSLIPARQAFDSLINEAFERQDYWLAESLLREYLAAGPRCVPYLEKLGSIYQHKGENIEAVTEYGKAIEILIEDPDPDNPTRASQLYKTIVDLAPASPVAIRFSGCFHEQTGEVLAKPPTFHHQEGTAEESDCSTPVEPTAGLMGSQSLPSAKSHEQMGYIIAERLDDTGFRGVDTAPSLPELPFSSAGSNEVLQEERRYDNSEGAPAETSSDGGNTGGLEWESAQAESEVVGIGLEPELQLSDGLSRAAQQDAVVQAVPPPMPWEEIREGATDIPDRSGAELSGEAPRVFVQDDASGRPAQDMSKPGAFSWDSVFDIAWKVGSSPSTLVPVSEIVQGNAVSDGGPSSSTLGPVSTREIDPGTIEIPKATRLPAQLDATTESVGAPMPWDHVQDSTITIPAAHTDVSAVESPVDRSAVSSQEAEPIEMVCSEPVAEPDSLLSIAAASNAEPVASAVSFVEPSLAPLVSAPEFSPADVPSELCLGSGSAAEETTEQQPFEVPFASEAVAPIEPDVAVSLSETGFPASFVDEVPPATQHEETTISPKTESIETPTVSDPDQAASQVELAPPSTVSDLPNWMTDGRTSQGDNPVSPILETVSQPDPEYAAATPVLEEPLACPIDQDEWKEPVVAEAEAPVPNPPLAQDEWRKPGESIRFLGGSHGATIADAESAAPVRDNHVMSPRASAAVDALFEPSERYSHTETRSHQAQKRSRRIPHFRLSRITDAVSVFIGSCFSTTRAIVASMIGSVVLAGLSAGLGVGAVGLVWVILEEPPSSTYRSMTTSPQRALIDPRNNGYLVLLGFDVRMDHDPIQAGIERKPDDKDADRALECLGGSGGNASVGQSSASAKVLNGWFKESNPVGRFTSHRGTIEGLASQAGGALSRYQQWHRLSFEDWGYGQTISPPCATITFAQHLYVAEGFTQGTEIGIDRIETDMETWRIVLSQARTLPMKTLALQVLNDDIAVVSGLLAQPDIEGKYLGRLAKMVRPLDQNELSLRWPMQSELVSAAKTYDAKLKAEKGEEQSVLAALASMLPLPEQRRLNRYADYYEASYRASGEGRHGALPKWSEYIHFPAKAMTDHFTNPIENVVGLEPLAPWDLYHGMVVDTDARLRLASLQAWIRRGPQDAELLPRIAKAGQNFYDPYTGLPMLVNLKKGVLYSVGQDGKDQDADLQADIVAVIPVNHAVAAVLNASTATATSR